MKFKNMSQKYYVVMEINGKKLLRNGQMTVQSDLDNCDWFPSKEIANNAITKTGHSDSFVESLTVNRAYNRFQNS